MEHAPTEITGSMWARGARMAGLRAIANIVRDLLATTEVLNVANSGLQLAGGLEKLSRGRKKFLTSGWTLKLTYAPHIQDLTSGWKSSEPYAKHMPRALSETTIKFTSGHQSLVDAYAQHQLSIKKYR